MIDIKEVRNLYKMFEDEDIETVEIQNGDMRIRFAVGETPKKPVLKTEVRKVKAEEAPKTAVVPAPEAAVEKTNVQELRSGWVGFFTRVNPAKGENYVKLRDVVKKGSVVGHVRVLGVLQDLKAESDGKVMEFLVEEGQPIEYGQPVMRFEI
jgi:biotin carboxyl carrier protein